MVGAFGLGLPGARGLVHLGRRTPRKGGCGSEGAKLGEERAQCVNGELVKDPSASWNTRDQESNPNLHVCPKQNDRNNPYGVERLVQSTVGRA